MSVSYTNQPAEAETKNYFRNIKESIELRDDIDENKKIKLSKLEITEVLFQHIVLTLIYITTCILVGVSKFATSEIQSTGTFIICLLWIPGTIILLHELYYDSIFVRSESMFWRILSAVIGLTFYPFLPVFLFLCYLYKPMDIKYFNRLKTMQNFNLFLHSSMHLILLIVLLLQDQLPENTACLVDSLGRSACLTVPVLLNIVLTIIILITSSVNLHNRKKRKLSTIINCLPYTFAAIMFRIMSYALMIIYIDKWAVIPIICIIFLHILFQGFNRNYMTDKQNSKAIDDVDGHHNYKHNYTLHWDGSTWSCKPIESDKPEDSSYENESDVQNLSSMLFGIQSSILYVHRRQDDLSWSLFCCYFGNGALISILLIIYILVNYVHFFYYGHNILDNIMFNYSIALSIIYGIISPILLNFQSTVHNCTKAIFALIFVVLIMFTPFIGWPILKNYVHSNSLHFYTISSSKNGSYVTSQAIAFSNHPKVAEQYDLSDLYFDVQCTDSNIFNKKFLFLNSSNQNCDDVIKNHKGTHIFVIETNLLRSSSPFQNKILLEDFTELRIALNLSGKMYISDNAPTLADVKVYLDCSSDNQIDLIPATDFESSKVNSSNCSTKKYMTSSGLILENQCVSIDGHQLNAKVKCKTLLADTIFRLNKTLIEKSLLASNDGKKYSFCCLNETHSIEFYGNCKSNSLVQFIEQEIIYRRGKCNEFLQQAFVSYYLVDSCLQSVFYQAYCKKPTVPLKNECQTLKCIDIFN